MSTSATQERIKILNSPYGPGRTTSAEHARRLVKRNRARMDGGCLFLLPHAIAKPGEHIDARAPIPGPQWPPELDVATMNGVDPTFLWPVVPNYGQPADPLKLIIDRGTSRHARN